MLKPQVTTKLENSHHDPVYEVYWMQSGKAGRECASTSTDGQVLWWDMRMPEEPVEKHILDHEFTEGSKKILGGTSMEWNNEAGPGKFLIGTEQGIILLVNKKQK